jgi:putative nucleotidyltransferase with HDIG domain
MKLFGKNNNKNMVALVMRAILFMALLVYLVIIFTVGTKPYKTELHEGDIAVKDIFAPFDFTYRGEADEKATQKLRQKATEGMHVIYDFDEKEQQAPSLYINKVFEAIKGVQQENLVREGKIVKLQNEFPNIKESVLITLLGIEGVSLVAEQVDGIIAQIASYPIITKVDQEALSKEKVAEVTLRDVKTKQEGVIKSDEMMTPDAVERRLFGDLVSTAFKDDVKLRTAVLELLKLSIVPNVKRNPEEFSRRVEEVRAQIPAVLREADVKKNEIILGRGERVQKHHLLQLEKIASAEMGEKAVGASPMSIAIILLLLLVITVISFRRYEPNIYANTLYLLLIAVVAAIFLLSARLIINSFLSSYFIPIASISMLIAILLSGNVAFLVTLMLSIACGIIAGNKFEMTVILLVGGIVGVYAVRGLRKRSQLLRAGALVGSANFVMISSFGILTNLESAVFLAEGAKGFLNGILSSFIVMGLLPFFEYLFKITTDITLLELSDLNHPLLKDLTLKAPGTYHHSLLVGNLAESACDAIGANALLARVGAYYHDIGKMEKAEYFTENIVDKKSQHDTLSPSMSSLVIINHVKDGVDLANKHKLPQTIINFVRQHHGNTLIYYFYQRALEKVSDESQLDEENFRYPGPKPQTKETAIVLLADAVEASSRTLSNPNPARIEGLVQKIINNKFIDGQLDECELTLKDLHRIAQSFVRILMGVFHSRVEYPEEEKSPGGKHKDKKTDEESDSQQSTS